MTRISITLAALAAVAVAAPAAAQYGRQYGGQYGDYASGDIDISSLAADIDAGVSRGDISSREAWTLRSQLRGLVNLQNQYARGGLSWSERNDLQQRALGLRNEIAQAGGYAAGYGRGDDRYDTRSGQYGGYGNGYNGYGNGYGGTAAGQAPYNAGTYGNGYSSGTYRSAPYDQGYAN